MILEDFFEVHTKIALGFSGGVDSAYLLVSGIKQGADIRPYFVRSAFQPEFELEDARTLCEELGVDLSIIDIDILSDEDICENGPSRCYFCKKKIFSAICRAAAADGYEFVIDGTNASDDEADRPGMRALKELNVKSPLRYCGITKDELRIKSKEMGLSQWDKPAYACLATRIPVNERITDEKLRKTEAAENVLFGMGFTDFRCLNISGSAVLRFKKDQIEKAKNEFEEIRSRIAPIYSSVSIDTKTR